MEESRTSRSCGQANAGQAVYTDIDGTVTAYNTIFEFLRFDAARQGRSAEAEDFLAGLRSSAANGVPRSVTNARYFRWWSGRAVDGIRHLGGLWADTQAGSPDDWAFLEPVASLLDAHAAAGRQLVAVTASFAPALEHVRRRWPTLELLCTEPVVTDGRYTGGIREALVGEAKARAVRRHAAVSGVDLDASYAYGDHSSDLPFMALAGESMLVGERLMPAAEVPPVKV